MIRRILVVAICLTLCGAAPRRDQADATRAAALAQAGLQDAEARLKAYFPFRTFPSGGAPEPWRFWGGDKTEVVTPPFFSRAGDAANPSFALEVDGDPDNADPTPITLMIGGAERGVTNVQGPDTYATNGDHYAVKVTDLSGLIYLNDGLDQGGAGSVSQNLRRILNVLGDVIIVPGLGDMILANRPVGGYTTRLELLNALGSDLAILDKVFPYVTMHAWVDSTVCNPVPLSAAMLSMYPVNYYRGTPPVYRHGSSLDANGSEAVPAGGLLTCPTACSSVPHDHPAIRVYGLDTLNPQWIEVVERAPVNLNSASREVLVALLSDLKGFFVTDRRRNNPRWQGELFLSFRNQMSYSPPGTEGDEYGFLMETAPIVGPGGAGGGISAFSIADHFIACRERSNFGGINYGVQWFRGPFKTWRQFDAFVDNLVTAGVIQDNRPIHVDYDWATSDPTGYGQQIQSAIQQQKASQAVADVLKANFNPNLHLNELNPDANLHRYVDKTDLIVHSTEFCLVPTGYFRVESAGRVVRPTNPLETDAFVAADNELAAQATATAVYRLYDLHRETNQSQFYGGQSSAAGGAVETNSGFALEIGPEPDNGDFTVLGQNEWGGYVALPTVGSTWHGAAVKAKNTEVKTLDLPATPHLGSALHVHFTLDSDAHHHVIDRNEIAGRVLADETVSNHPDRVGGASVAYSGPYDVTKGVGPNRHRICRSFRLSGGSPPPLPPYAPSDLRVDGLYAERHCSPAYYTQQGAAKLWNFSTTPASGMVSFWFKPSFQPELTGKIRKLWSMSRYHQPCGNFVYMWPFELVFMPVHYIQGSAETQSENPSGPRLWSINVGEYHPASMYFGSRTWHSDEIADLSAPGASSHRFGNASRSLNHIGHADETVNPTVMKGHQWTNVSFWWDAALAYPSTSQVFFNGTSGEVPYTFTTMGGSSTLLGVMTGFEQHAGGGEFNQMRFGAPSQIAVGAKVASLPGVVGAYRGNTTPDFTIDELYVWQARVDGDPRLLWLRGRYARPVSGATFTSQAISLPPAAEPGPPPVKILGVAWTWYGEETSSTGSPVLYDYNTPEGTAAGDVGPQVSLSIQDGAMVYGPMLDDGFSAAQDLSGMPPVMADPTQVKYLAQFSLASASGATILLATPVLDDVTIYWDNSRSNTRLDNEPALAFTGPAAIPDLMAGEPFTETFTAVGAGPITWSVTGTLPPGLTFDPATGTLSGTPGGSGSYTFTVTGSDGIDAVSSEITLTVLPGTTPAGGGSGGGGGGCGSCGALGIEIPLLLLLLAAIRRRRSKP